MSIGYRWLDRALFTGPYLALVLSESEFRSALRRLKVKDPGEWLPASCSACVHTYERSGAHLTCIVALRETALDLEPMAVIGTLVHEAVHVWQKIEAAASLGDPGKFGTESEAYAIENIAMQLITEYQRRWRKKRESA